jgi:PKD repeat protein
MSVQRGVLLTLFLFGTLVIPISAYNVTGFGGIDWQKCLGGLRDDVASSIQQTTDGGYIVAGYSYSNDGNVTGNHGDYDYWVVKLDRTGTILWQKCLGGSADDQANSIQQTADGGYIIAGYTSSNNGDVTGNHGISDYWVVKLTASGTMDWQRCLGGIFSDYAQSVQQTTDGGFIIAGSTASNDGNVDGNHGQFDYWIVKLDSTGTLIWQKCLGGTDYDMGINIQQTEDMGYIVAGGTASNNDDVTGNHGDWDYWIVKLNSTGTIVWQKCLGGTGTDYAKSIQQTADGGYLVVGYTISNNGNVDGNHGSYDYWVVKLDRTGTILWQKCLGGISTEQAQSIQQTADGGYIISGYTTSNNGDVTGNHGAADYWIIKLNNTGTILWQKCLGGISTEQAQSIQQTADGGYIVAGVTLSNDGNVTGNHGRQDYWVVKLNSDMTLNLNAVPTTGIAPLNVTFSYSINPGNIFLINPEFNWSFGDGTFSTLWKPTHTYLGAGNYTVSLMMHDSAGKNLAITAENYMHVNSPPRIHLSPGWNFVSTPRKLSKENNTATIFANVNTSGRSIWIYNASAQQWTVMGPSSLIQPLDAIWIYSNKTTITNLSFDTSPMQTPPTKTLSTGWNAIGYSDTTPASTSTALNSVQTKWSTLIGFDASQQTYESSIVRGATDPIHGDQKNMYPEKGYWLYMTEAGTLAAMSV